MADSLSWPLAQVVGLKEPVVPVSPLDDITGKITSAVNVDGKIGRAVDYIALSNKVLVLLLDGYYIEVPEDCLKEYQPEPPEEGGFDAAWPALQEQYDDFALLVGRRLESRGWCLVQLPSLQETYDDAAADAKNRSKFTALKKELVTDYLGRGGKGKTAFLPQEQRGENKRGGLASLDRTITSLTDFLAPLTEDAMAFRVGERTDAMVWMPYEGSKDERALAPEPLNADDVEEGRVEEHIKFLRRRRLCCMVWLENDGGSVTLLPKPDHPTGATSVQLPLSTKKMLIYRCDQMTFQYEPKASSIVLQAWVLEEESKLVVNKVEGDLLSKSEAYGVTRGRPHPGGDRIRIFSTWTRLPGGAYGGEKYWAMLLEGTDGEVKIPNYRFDVELYSSDPDGDHIPGLIYAQHGGFCKNEEIYQFDNEFFDISADEAMNMAPTQRVLLEDAYSVLYLGGYDKKSLLGKRMGLFVGDTGSDWAPMFPEHEIDAGNGSTFKVNGRSTYGLMGSKNYATASRALHCLDLVGPHLTADTACSSSLVATGAAMMWLRKRDVGPEFKHLESRLEEAVCGGVCTQVGPGSYIGMCAINMISPNGRCFTFDESGDGYARGEGVTLFYVRASNKEEDCFSSSGTILGACINQDGRSASMTAPNGPSQQACIKQSMLESEVEARMINLAECHGTGTALGDPIEVGALRSVMEPRDFALCLTSSKSNIGHLEGGAGTAGLMKCVLMLGVGTCPPNAHCRQLNPHLGVNGFPCFFDTEGIDTMLNSALTGVSSFGFGGTNGRCDIWGNSRQGQYKSGDLSTEALDQLFVMCPITLGPIDHISGEPVKPPKGDRTRYRADALRDEFAPYDISAEAYTGGYRWRLEEAEAEEEGEELEEFLAPHIRGSWSGWTEMEEMESEGDGWYSATMVLGESRCEHFDICLGKDPNLAVYPAVPNASSKIWVYGPDDQGEGRKWAIDGRDMELPAGTVFQIRFKYSTQKMQLSWSETADKDLAATALSFEHTYYLTSSATKWKPVALTAGADGGSWEGAFTLNAHGSADFAFLRDQDWQQAIYPAKHKGLDESCPVRGPDELSGKKYFRASGQPGEEVTVKLTIVDAKVSVAMTLPSKGTKEWKSVEGWDRHQYSVVGSFKFGEPIPMSMDVMSPGKFTCKATMGADYNENAGGFTEYFQVLVDADKEIGFYPEMGLAGSGETIVKGPNNQGTDKMFFVRAPVPYATLEITLDLTAEDRRQTVTWSWVSGQEALTMD